MHAEFMKKYDEEIERNELMQDMKFTEEKLASKREERGEVDLGNGMKYTG